MLNGDNEEKDVSQVSATSTNYLKEISGATTKTPPHSRTPSGNILTDKVQNNRLLFSPSTKEAVKRKREDDFLESVNKGQKVHTSDINLSVVNKIKGRARKLSQSRSASLDRWVNKNTTSANHDQRVRSLSDLEKLSTSITEPTLEDLRSIAFTIDSATTAKIMRAELNEQSPSNTNSLNTSTEEHMEMSIPPDTESNPEINATMNPSVMSVITVQEMFASLKGEIEKLSTKVEEIQQGKDQQVSDAAVEKCANLALQKVNANFEADVSDVQKIKNDLKYYKRKNPYAYRRSTKNVSPNGGNAK